jgi:hypothetical protein
MRVVLSSPPGAAESSSKLRIKELRETCSDTPKALNQSEMCPLEALLLLLLACQCLGKRHTNIVTAPYTPLPPL